MPRTEETRVRKPITNQYHWSQSPATFDRSLNTIEKKAVLEGYFNEQAAQLVQTANGKKVTVFDFGSGSGAAVDEFSQLLSESNLESRVIGLGEDPDKQQHHRLRKSTQLAQVTTEHWDYTVTGAQSLEHFFNAQAVTAIDFGWASFSLMYLSARQMDTTLTAIIDRLVLGAQFLILNLGSRHSLEKKFSSFDEPIVKLNLASELLEINKFALLSRVAELDHNHLAAILNETVIAERVHDHLETIFATLVKMAVAVGSNQQPDKADEFAKSIWTDAAEAAELEFERIQHELPDGIHELRFIRLLRFPYVAIVVIKILQEQYLKKQFILRQQVLREILAAQTTELTPLFSSDGFPVHCILTKI